MKPFVLLFLLLAALSPAAFGQSAQPAPAANSQATAPPANAPNPPGEDGIGLAPARFELPMRPGTERTIVVNIIYNSTSNEARPCRLMATLGDWTILPDGNIEYYKPGTLANSATSWMIYSPGEVTAMPGKVHPVRVTISVPKEATPGDHLAALFVESRPDNLKLEQNQKQVILRFRMAALFYIMVPDLTRKGALDNLKASPENGRISVVPTIKNSGNSHIRPIHSVRVLDANGAVVAALPEAEALPVLATSTLSHALLIDKAIAPGSYSVVYRIDFKDGSPIVEGQTALTVKAPVANKGATPAATAETKMRDAERKE